MNKRQAMKFVLYDRRNRNRPPTYIQTLDAQALLLRRGWSWNNLTHKYKFKPWRIK